ncbi:DUF1304 domain-containing protein [Microbacterium sp. P05]|uniref:DUF1304 domain-containing protein n=1 Tax=Microbacterium sp. P05 TaxID=3366948 RepID=UPI0037462E6B
MAAIVATVFGSLAALVHLYIFVLESVRWTRPRTWQIFGIADQAAADTIRPMAFNQGFYNLFLAIGAAVGLALLWIGAPGTVADVAGRTLALFTLASMVAASLVLLTGGTRYLRPALLQGAAPLIGFVFLLFA